MRNAFSMLALLAATVCPAAAQEPETRAAEIAGKQLEKAGRKEGGPPNWFEQRLLNIERSGGLAVRSGWFVTFGDIKSGSGFALGPAYGKLFDNGAMIYVKGAYSIRNFKMGQLSLEAPPLAAGRLAVNGRVRWQDAPTLAVYPIGANSIETRFDFSETKTEISGRAMFRPVPFLHLGGGVSFENFDTTPVVLEDPPANGSLDLGFIPGSGSDPRYVHSHVSAAYDGRDGPGYSRRGSVLQATLHDFRQQNGDGLSFQRIDAQAQQYIPLLHGNWVLFFGVRASSTSASDGNVVPFFLMPQLGGNDLRGFNNYRFRDRHSLLFTAEYRWYVQEFVDMAIFYDAGEVAAERSELDFDGLESSAGAGIRFHGPQTTVVRLEVAASREGWRFIFGFSPVGGR